MYGYSHQQDGPWVGRDYSTNYFETPSQALESGRAAFYHAGMAAEGKMPVWVAKLEAVAVSDFMVSGLQIFLSDMKERAVVEFESGGQALADWLDMYAPSDEDPWKSYTALMDLNFGRMMDYQSNSEHWPVPALTRVCKGSSGGYQKAEVPHDQNPRWSW